MDMKTVDTLACFSDSKMSNNFVNNKAIEKIKKGCKLDCIHYHTKVFKWFYDNFEIFVDVPSWVIQTTVTEQIPNLWPLYNFLKVKMTISFESIKIFKFCKQYLIT